MDIITRLEKIALFTSLRNKKDALQTIANIIKVENFKSGAYIIREGESGDKMYILNRGTVRVEKNTLSNDTFTVVNIKDDMNGFFGEIALIDNDVRSASVLALTPVECFVLEKRDFDRLCEANTEIGYIIVKEFAKSLTAKLRKETLDKFNLIHALLSEDVEG